MKTIVLLPSVMLASLLAPAQTPSESLSKFAFDFYRNTSRAEKGNLFFAPASISPAMSMAYLGARGETETEISRVFHFPANNVEFHRNYCHFINGLTGRRSEGIELAIANRMWLDRSYTVTRAYRKTLKKAYGASANYVDFINSSESSRQKINSAIEGDTRGIIKDLLPLGSVNPLTRLVLTNAIYFKGKWAKVFDPQKTNNRDFYINENETVSCPMMPLEDTFNFYKGEYYQALEMAYRGEQLSMVVFLPEKNFTLAEFEEDFTYQKYVETLGSMTPQKVSILIPKFKTESQFALKNTLSGMGMPLAFSDKANFTGLTRKNDLLIAEVFHKAFIEVSEEGTKAAAATGVVMAMKSMLQRNIFIANRPFIYIIKDNSTKAVLFMGRVADPTK